MLGIPWQNRKTAKRIQEKAKLQTSKYCWNNQNNKMVLSRLPSSCKRRSLDYKINKMDSPKKREIEHKKDKMTGQDKKNW